MGEERRPEAASAGQYRVPDHVLRAPLEEGEVLLNPETGAYHLVNGTGRAILAELEAGLTVPDAAGRVSGTTGHPAKEVLEDTKQLVRSMMERGLLKERLE
jgi:Coenzyme PQQ synthesis protein D (PqqD)